MVGGRYGVWLHSWFKIPAFAGMTGGVTGGGMTGRTGGHHGWEAVTIRFDFEVFHFVVIEGEFFRREPTLTYRPGLYHVFLGAGIGIASRVDSPRPWGVAGPRLRGGFEGVRGGGEGWGAGYVGWALRGGGGARGGFEGGAGGERAPLVPICRFGFPCPGRWRLCRLGWRGLRPRGRCRGTQRG